MRQLLPLLLILLFSAVTNGQTECTLTTDQSPRLLNLKLGMTVKEVNSSIGRGLNVKAKSEGERTFFKNFIKKNGKGAMEPVRAIFLSFYDGNLYQIEVFYQDDSGFSSVDSLLTDLSASSGFDVDLWQIKNGYAKAKCQGFTLEADRVLNPHIQITDDAVLAVVEEERKKN